MDKQRCHLFKRLCYYIRLQIFTVVWVCAFSVWHIGDARFECCQIVTLLALRKGKLSFGYFMSFNVFAYSRRCHLIQTYCMLISFELFISAAARSLGKCCWLWTIRHHRNPFGLMWHVCVPSEYANPLTKKANVKRSPISSYAPLPATPARPPYMKTWQKCS